MQGIHNWRKTRLLRSSTRQILTRKRCTDVRVEAYSLESCGQSRRLAHPPRNCTVRRLPSNRQRTSTWRDAEREAERRVQQRATRGSKEGIYSILYTNSYNKDIDISYEYSSSRTSNSKRTNVVLARISCEYQRNSINGQSQSPQTASAGLNGPSGFTSNTEGKPVPRKNTQRSLKITVANSPYAITR